MTAADFERENERLLEDFAAQGEAFKKRLDTLSVVKDDLQQLLVALFLARLIGHYEGIGVLVRSGLPVEARILLRTLTECHIKLHAAAGNRQYAERMVGGSERERIKLLRAVQAHGSVTDPKEISFLLSTVKSGDYSRKVAEET